MEDIDLHHLSTLVAVIDCGTFDAAANQLHVTPSAISQRVKALESAVGCILLQRTKPIQPTQSGQELLSLARQIQLLSKEFSNRLHHETVAKLHIPLAVNADSLGTWMMPALAQAGEVATFEIYRDDEEYSAAMLRNGTVMAAVTSAAKPVQGCSSTRLGTMRYLAMATKDFTARWFPHGPTPQALSQAPVILFDRKDELQNRYLAQHIPDVTSVPVNYIPSTADYAQAVIIGLGWGYIPELQLPQLPQSHNLEEFDPSAFIDITLYWQQWKLSSPMLNTVASIICTYASKHLR